VFAIRIIQYFGIIKKIFLIQFIHVSFLYESNNAIFVINKITHIHVYLTGIIETKNCILVYKPWKPKTVSGAYLKLLIKFVVAGLQGICGS
jgi:hypothetical protein